MRVPSPGQSTVIAEITPKIKRGFWRLIRGIRCRHRKRQFDKSSYSRRQRGHNALISCYNRTCFLNFLGRKYIRVVGASQSLDTRIRVEHEVLCTKENVACRTDSIYDYRDGGIIAKHFEFTVEDLKNDVAFESRRYFDVFSVDSSLEEWLTVNQERKPGAIGIFTNHIQ